MDWQAQQGLQRAKWGLKYNIMVSKNHCMCVSFTSWCEQLILGVKHIVPTFEHSAAWYLQVTCQLLHQENQINHIESGMSHLKISFRLWFYIACRVGGGRRIARKQVTRSQPAEIYATITPPKHSPLCLSQIIASVQMLLSYITWH